jgi:GntR family transcriptional regulator/MocR family aminotransferase
MSQARGMSPRQWRSLSERLDQHAGTPIYRQIYQRLREAITSGTLRPGDRLPSARSLASQLAAARGTIDSAYELLASEGYIVSRGAGGTFVSPDLAAVLQVPPTAAGHDSRQPALPTTAVDSLEQAASRAATVPEQPFQLGLPALDAFPRKVWARLATKRARDLPVTALRSPDPFGYRPLREAIASYLAVARGIRCSPEAIVITSGFQGAMGLITRTLLNPGEAVWVEDPGYIHARRALIAAAAKLIPVPVDERGMDVAAGLARAPLARLAVVTPSHQFPLGVALELSRRLSLLAWANQAGAWIVEDDYDGEFRYDSKPLPALKSLDERDRVLYAGTFSKVLFPGLRLGYVVLPAAVIEDFERTLYNFYRDGSTFVGSVVADFMAQGHFARHIKRMRQLYAERRAALAAALHEVFAERFRIELQAGGMHLLAYLARAEKDTALIRKADAQGVVLNALSACTMEHDRGQGLVLGFTNIPAQSALKQAKRLERALTAR